MNTVLFLMNPDGYPAMTDDFTNGYRNYAIQDILFDKYIDRNKIIIVTTKLETERYKEIRDFIEKAGYTWLEVDKDLNLSQLSHTLEKVYNFVINPADTNIIYGGTNTSSDVLHSSELSIGRFADRGYKCQLYLPLCADIRMPGICQIDKEMKAFAEVYSFIKSNNLFNRIDLLTRFADLTLPWREKNEN